MNTPPSQWIGKTARIAANLWKQIPKLQSIPDPCERRYLFTGVPGIGKTDVAEHLAAALTGEDFDRVHARMAVNVEIINGQSCSIDVVRKWQEIGHYRPLFGQCRVILVDEVDGMSAAALNEIRSYLDRLPPATVFLATTNKPLHELQEQLQSRFKVCFFEKVQEEDITQWLINTYQLPPAYARQAAKGAQGNARAAKIDALAWKEANE
jgi:DNA polymerase III delta prime subunit